MLWKEKYRIGVELIDTQHQELFKRVESFLDVVQSKEEWQEKLGEIKNTMGFMQEYVVRHFADEEEFMQSINYPYLERHHEEHAKFKQAVGDYVERLQMEGYSEELVQEFGGKLMTWLILHVAAQDQKVGKYVAEQGGEE